MLSLTLCLLIRHLETFNLSQGKNVATQPIHLTQRLETNFKHISTTAWFLDIHQQWLL